MLGPWENFKVKPTIQPTGPDPYPSLIYSMT